MSTAQRAALLGLGAALLLAGCGKPALVPYSRKPLVSEVEAQAAPALRPGLWLKVDPNCAFDIEKPRGAWPDCAAAIVVRENEMLRLQSADVISEDRFRLADGLPMILQVQSLPITPPTEWRFYGLRPTFEGGDIVEYSSWSAMCGPNGDAASTDSPAVRTPAPAKKGELPLDEDSRCLIGSRDELRSTIIASEGWTADREHLRWIRSAEQ